MINKRYTPVSGNSSFARDKITGAIVNINTNEFDQGEKRRQLAREEKQKMISLQNKVDHLDELDDAMARCFAEKEKLVFMDIAVDQDEHVYPMQIKYGAMDDMRLSKTERT